MLRSEIAAIAPDSPENEDNFERYIDERDLNGSSDRWTGGYGQYVQAVVKRPSAHQLDNEGSLVDLHEKLDSLVAQFDDRFRTAGD